MRLEALFVRNFFPHYRHLAASVFTTYSYVKTRFNNEIIEDFIIEKYTVDEERALDG